MTMTRLIHCTPYDQESLRLGNVPMMSKFMCLNDWYGQSVLFVKSLLIANCYK